MPYDPNEAFGIVDEKDFTRVPAWASLGACESWSAATGIAKSLFEQAFQRTPVEGNREDSLLLLECFVRDLENQGENDIETAKSQTERDEANAVLRLAAHARFLLTGWCADADEADDFGFRVSDGISRSWVLC